MSSVAEKVHEILKSNDIKKFRESNFNAADLLKFKHENYKNALLYAARWCSCKITIEIIEILKSSHSEGKRFKEIIDATDKNDRDVFSLAAVADNPDLLKYLMDHLKFKVNSFEKAKRTALWHAIDKESKKAFYFLLEAGARFSEDEKKLLNEKPTLKAQFNTPKTLLMLARAGNRNALDYLLHYVENISLEDQKPFLDARDYAGRTALILAAEKNPVMITALTKKLKFNVNLVDKIGHSALWYLSKKGLGTLLADLADKTSNLDYKTAKEIAEFSKKIAPATDKAKKDFARALTSPINGVKQMGRMPKTADKEIIRPYRSYSTERERQVLRQVATQLYFAITEKVTKEVTELQILHLSFADKHNLFIAANGFEINNTVANYMKTADLRELLIKAYPISNPEGKARTERFSTKLNNRVFQPILNLPLATLESDRNQAKQVGEILRSGTLKILNIALHNDQFSALTIKNVLNALNDKQGNIYLLVITQSRNPNRHAEEFLTDIVEFANGKEKNVYSCIAGKKRPCLGCSGRMQGVVSQYSNKPGLFWLHTMEFQPKAVAAKTLNVLLTELPNVSLNKNGTNTFRDHDSGSDSECDVSETEDENSDNVSDCETNSTSGSSSSAQSDSDEHSSSDASLSDDDHTDDNQSHDDKIDANNDSTLESSGLGVDSDDLETISVKQKLNF